MIREVNTAIVSGSLKNQAPPRSIRLLIQSCSNPDHNHILQKKYGEGNSNLWLLMAIWLSISWVYLFHFSFSEIFSLRLLKKIKSEWIVTNTTCLERCKEPNYAISMSKRMLVLVRNIVPWTYRSHWHQLNSSCPAAWGSLALVFVILASVTVDAFLRACLKYGKFYRL